MLLSWIHDSEQMQVYVSNKHSYEYMLLESWCCKRPVYTGVQNEHKQAVRCYKLLFPLRVTLSLARAFRFSYNMLHHV